ncbi:fibronectin type III domain-containing protein [Nocardia sp. NPDC051756]|uniref:fibronectin type III domain-containing protein n=1 Tax=Nocardia sp. NPDC051756 TaxID=3154751 RepID=UPI00342404A2
MDASTYKSTVLIPLRKAHLTDLTNGIAELNNGADFPVKLDLALVYAIDPGMSDAQVAERVRDVRLWWNVNMQRSNVKEVAKFCSNLDGLLAEKHRDLASAGFWQKWRSQRTQQSRTALAEVAKLLEHQYRDFGVVTLAQVKAAAATDGLLSRLSDTDLTACLESSVALTLVDEFTEPEAGLPATVRREWNSTVNLRTVLDAVFFETPPENFRLIGGFACSGLRPPDPGTLRQALDACDKRAGTEVEAVKKLLHALRDAQTKGLDPAELALVQLIELAREVLQGGIALLAIQALADKGLDRIDAARIVMHCVDASATRSGRDTPDRVIELLTEGKLRGARALYSALSNVEAHAGTEAMDKALDALTKTEQQVSRLRAEAEQALHDGRITAATELLAQAGALADDDDSLARLIASLPPAPPSALNLAPDFPPAVPEQSVRIFWPKSSGADETTVYEVVRKAGSAPRDIRDGVAISATPSTEVVDSGAPVAERLWYGVAARRGGEASPVTTAEIVLLPPVRDVVVTTDPTSIGVQWISPVGAARTAVVRTDPDGRQRTLSPRASNSFVAEGLRTSETYTFDLTAEYIGANGEALAAAPVRVRAVPRLKAAPVTELSVRPVRFVDARAEVVAEWTAKAGTDIEVWRFPSSPGWAFGSTVEYSALTAAGGSRLPGVLRRDGDLERLTGTVPAGLCHYLAITPDQSAALVGRSASLAVCEPVTEPRVERFGDQAVVSWLWPRADYRVEAVWSAGTHRGSARISRPEYIRNGGMRISVGPGAVQIRLASIVESAEGRWSSPEVLLQLSGATLTARYRMLWPPRLIGRGPLQIEFTADTETRGAVVVVHAESGAYLPQRMSENCVVQRIPLDIPMGEPQIVPVPLPKLPKPFWVRCFAEAPETLTLADPPSDTLKGR